ncbi:MAG: glycerol-3-phosphate 1-O-acyltransferase PlsY [Rhodospirillales bacterium]
MTTSYLPMLYAVILGYALGSIPFGLLLTRAAGLGDIRAIGSGNIGATNVLRTGRRGLAAATLLCDALKGVVPVLLADRLWGVEAATVAGLFAVLGHLFPVWLGFKGGKGMATTLGVLLTIAWPIGVLGCLVWLLVAVLFRYSSLATLLALLVMAVVAWALDLAEPSGWLAINNYTGLLATVITVLVFLKHHQNIGRLLNGSEAKIGKQ